jgi:hypothetical protein
MTSEEIKLGNDKSITGKKYNINKSIAGNCFGHALTGRKDITIDRITYDDLIKFGYNKTVPNPEAGDIMVLKGPNGEIIHAEKVKSVEDQKITTLRTFPDVPVEEVTATLSQMRSRIGETIGESQTEITDVQFVSN